MGEIADAMLDGTLCEGCGEYIGSDAGYPQYCSPECAAGRGVEYTEPDFDPELAIAHYPCDLCGKRFRKTAYLEQHRRDKHG